MSIIQYLIVSLLRGHLILRIETCTSHMQSICSTIELQPGPHILFKPKSQYFRRMEWKKSLCLLQTQEEEKNTFSKNKQIIIDDLKESNSHASPSKRKKLPSNDQKEAGNKIVSKKERKFSFKEEALSSSGPEEAVSSKNSGSKKKEK